MNNSPVLKLQEMASSRATDIEDLLSKAKMISAKLSLQDVSEWLEHELNSYPDDASLPEYRIIKDAKIMAFNPYRGWIPFQLGNLMQNHQDVYEQLTTIYFTNPVSMLAEYAKSESTLYCELPETYLDVLQDIGNCDFRMSWAISPSLITKILSNTRSKVLDWALLLETKGILGEGLLFSQEEKVEAKNMTINNINTFHGNVNNAGAIGAGSNGDVTQKNIVNVGDFDSLKNQLEEWGVSEQDILALKKAIHESPKPTTANNFGSDIGKWLGDIVGKAYSGSLKIAASSAPALLTNAICHYYNIPV